MQNNQKNTLHTPQTWLVYLLLSLYVYCLNVPGPITGYLQQEFNLSYTASSLHFSAFALGMLVPGLLAGRFIHRIRPWRVIAIGAVGLGVGALVLTFGKQPALTISGLFLMGCIGTLILSIYPAILDREMGSRSAVGISEANTIASVFAALAPLSVGMLASTVVGWRLGSLVVAAVSLLLGVAIWIKAGKESVSSSTKPTKSVSSGKLPGLFWVLWVAIVLSVSIEFCSVYWGADFIEKVIGLNKDAATQSVSLFLAGMIVGRFIGGMLMHKVSEKTILFVSIMLGLIGFGFFWTGVSPLLGLVGITVLGLGVANLYIITLSQAIRSAGINKALAGSRTTLASGVAIFLLPLVLGNIADQVGIRLAFLIILALYAALILTLLSVERVSKQPLEDQGSEAASVDQLQG